MLKLKEKSPEDFLHYCKKSGFDITVDPSTGDTSGIIPRGFATLFAISAEQINAQNEALDSFSVTPIVFSDLTNEEQLMLIALDESVTAELVSKVFDKITNVAGHGDTIKLPKTTVMKPTKLTNHTENKFSIHDAPTDRNDDDLPQQISGGTPLDKYSLLGTGAELEASAVKSVPLLGRVAMLGQATVFYSAPNTGKTLVTLSLLTEAAQAGRLDASRCYYVNADDSQQGLGEKTAILDEDGIHTLAPGTKGFTTAKLVQTMHDMVKEDACNGVVIVVDTLKKFVDLMDKKQSAGFGDSVRQFVSKGGTFVALAHTRKNVGTNGESVYGGTSDILEDFDAACLMVPLQARSPKDEKLVKFQFKKRRGNNVDEIYAYDDHPDSSYGKRFVSVRHVEDDENDRFAEAENRRTDEQLIATIRGFIEADDMQKMALVKAVAQKTGVSRRSAMAVLERYTGDDPIKHHWCFAVGERGAKNYRAHPLCEMGC